MSEQDENGMRDASTTLIVEHLLIRDLDTGEKILNQRAPLAPKPIFVSPLNDEDDPDTSD